MDDYLKHNKAHWNKVTPIHTASKFYDIENFKKGKSNLMHLELKEVGDVKGKTLLHLQCHFGMGTLSWAREGAITTGIDLSEESIREAQKLSQEINVPSKFICTDIYNSPNVLNEKFDIVFTSYGVLPWLPDLKKWAEVINHFLKPGGIFYIVESHPFTWMMNDEFQFKYPYFIKEPIIDEESQGTYTDSTVDITTTTYEWNHTLDEIVNSLIDQELTIEFLHEFPFNHFDSYPGLMEKDEEGWYWMKGKNDFPMLFSLKARK